MRLFSITPKTSPELVRHSLVSEHSRVEEPTRQTGDATPPRTHSPSLVRGVSTLGRKFSRRFEKFGDSEAARRLRIASPSRKYHFGANGNNLSTIPSGPSSSTTTTGPPPTNATKKPVSRVDSFRNFFLSTSSTLKTPRAVKRRSRNTEKRGGRGSNADDDGTASAGEELGSHHRARSDPRDHRFGSELTLVESDYGECQSEADLRYYTEDDDDRSVVSDSHGFRPLAAKKQFVQREQHRSAGNLAAFRLGILPENRTINFREPGIVYADSNGLQIKSYGLIDGKEINNNNDVRKKSNTSHESGYSSENNTSPNSSRASPRSSPEGEGRVGNKLDPRSLTPSPPVVSSCQSTPPPPLLPKPLAVPPKKPARTKIPSVSLLSHGRDKKPSSSLSSLTDEEKMQMIFTTKRSPKESSFSSMQQQQQQHKEVNPEKLANPEETKVSSRSQRTSKSKKSPMIDVAVAEDEDDSCSSSSIGGANNDNSSSVKKEYKIIRYKYNRILNFVNLIDVIRRCLLSRDEFGGTNLGSSSHLYIVEVNFRALLLC